MAMVEEQGSTAMVCGKVNFGAFRGKVSIALQRGRAHIAMRCGGGVDTAVICGIAISPCSVGRAQLLQYGGEKGEPRRWRASKLPRLSERSIWHRVLRQCLRFFCILSGRSIFQSALLNLPQKGSSYLPAS